jgi:hypothetical protein
MPTRRLCLAFAPRERSCDFHPILHCNSEPGVLLSNQTLDFPSYPSGRFRQQESRRLRGSYPLRQTQGERLIQRQSSGFDGIGPAGLAPGATETGASASRSRNRARDSLVLTVVIVSPRSADVSLILNCCTSRKNNTERYLAGRNCKALLSASRTSVRSNASDGIGRQSATSRGM